MAYLIHKIQKSKKIQLADYCLIGSDQGCQWQIAEAQDRHAKIEKKEGEYFVRDLRSGSGTFLNGQRIWEAPLQDGDWIKIENHEMIFSLEQEQRVVALSSQNLSWDQKLKHLSAFAVSDFPVLVLGPSGSGKEVIAKSLHENSSRRSRPFISVNCSSLSEALIESELFGHLRGSFTGAVNDRKGAFEAARGGTLFLDEIGDLPLSLQAKLLRALENNEIRPLGSDSVIKTDVRIVAATHKNLMGKIKNHEFRADLYYRLNVINIETPSLSDRMEDFEDILAHFARHFRVRFTPNAIARLRMHPWPGNIRELRNTVARASALYPQNAVDESQVDTILDRLSAPKAEPVETALPALPLIKEMEKQMILKKLSANKGNQKKTAKDLGLPKSTLHDRIRTYQIDVKSFIPMRILEA